MERYADVRHDPGMTFSDAPLREDLDAFVHPGWSPPHRSRPVDSLGAILSGAIMGAGGGALMVVAADGLARALGRSVFSVLRTALQPLRPDALTPDQTVWALAAIGGMAIGIPIVSGMRHVSRIRARLLFAVMLCPLLWTFAHAFLLLRFVPELGRELPFAAMAFGAVAYGACVGLAPPLGRRPR